MCTRTQLTRLGAELRRVRTLAGLSGRQVARATGLSQPTVSRIERGESVPSLAEVLAWTDAAQVGAERKEIILGMTEAAVNEVTTLRARLSNGLAAVQEDVRKPWRPLPAPCGTSSRESSPACCRPPRMRAGSCPSLSTRPDVGPAVGGPSRVARRSSTSPAGRSSSC